jgi:cytochrome c553
MSWRERQRSGIEIPAIDRTIDLYIANQLHAWKQGTRRGDPLGLMQTVAGKLSDADIRAVSDYFAAQAGGSPSEYGKR